MTHGSVFVAIGWSRRSRMSITYPTDRERGEQVQERHPLEQRDELLRPRQDEDDQERRCREARTSVPDHSIRGMLARGEYA